MNEDIPILPALLALLAVAYLGFEINRQRSSLREVFDPFDKQESVIAEALETMVARGEIKPYVPH